MTQFPSSIISFSTKANGQVIDASHINSPQDEIAALETKVGIDNSSVTTSLDYLIKDANSNGGGHVQTANKGGTGQTSFAKGDLLVASSSSVLSKLTVGVDGKFLATDSGASAGISWKAAADNTTFIPAGVGGGIPQGANVSIVAAAQYSQVIVYSFLDGANQELSMSTIVPTGFTNISSIKAVIAGDGIGGAAYLNFTTTRFPIGSASIIAGVVDGTDTASVYAIQATSSIQQLAVPSRAYDTVSTVSGGDVIAISMKRTGADAADTHSTNLDLAGFIIKWS